MISRRIENVRLRDSTMVTFELEIRRLSERQVCRSDIH